MKDSNGQIKIFAGHSSPKDSTFTEHRSDCTIKSVRETVDGVGHGTKGQGRKTGNRGLPCRYIIMDETTPFAGSWRASDGLSEKARKVLSHKKLFETYKTRTDRGNPKKGEHR